jgi:hypothetical protein
MAKLLTVTIANGASLSGVVEIGGSKPVLIDVPGWTAAAITFQASHDGVTFRNLYDEDAAEVNCSSFSTGRVVQLPSQLEGVAFLKLRSGTAATPVNQGSARSLKLTAV